MSSLRSILFWAAVTVICGWLSWKIFTAPFWLTEAILNGLVEQAETNNTAVSAGFIHVLPILGL